MSESIYTVQEQLEFDHLMWSAIESALGREKVAYLLHTPLSELLDNRLERELGTTVDHTLANAVAYTVSKLAYTDRFWSDVRQGLDSLEWLQCNGYDVQPTADDLDNEKTAGIHDYQIQEIAQGYVHDHTELSRRASMTKFANVATNTVDAAEGIGGLARRGLDKVKEFAGTDTGKFTGKALIGTGMAAGAGKYLINDAEKKVQGAMLPMAGAVAGGHLIGGVGQGIGSKMLGA